MISLQVVDGDVQESRWKKILPEIMRKQQPVQWLLKYQVLFTWTCMLEGVRFLGVCFVLFCSKSRGCTMCPGRKEGRQNGRKRGREYISHKNCLHASACKTVEKSVLSVSKCGIWHEVLYIQKHFWEKQQTSENAGFVHEIKNVP